MGAAKKLKKSDAADEDILAELPDLIETLEVALDDLRCATTVETHGDLVENLVSANITLDRVKTELRELLRAADRTADD